MNGISLARPDNVLRHSRETLGEWAAASDEAAATAHPVRAASPPSLFPGLEQGLALVSRAALGRGYTRFARKAAAAAVGLAPDSSVANRAFGISLRRSGEHVRALSHMQKAAAQDDARQRANWELAKLLLHLERSSVLPEVAKRYRAARLAALRAAHTSTDLRTKRRAAVALADALTETGCAVDALTVIEPVLKEAPQDRHAMRAAIYSLVAQGRLAEACVLYRRLVAIEHESARLKPLRALAPLCEGEAAQQTPSAGKAASWLIAVGGGIGDILHCTPMIANVARRTGERVDVLVLGDHPGAEFLVRNPQYVNRIWTLTPNVLQQSYRAVFVTHSFGPLRFAFKADRLANARDWFPFRPGRLHQTLFNLEAAKALFGIPYEDQDAARYFVGDVEASPQREPLIGLHAGSKSGRWLSKRWPYFIELSARLSARGTRVASFGTADEYVEGSENRTGGTIEEMCRSMRDCSLFVSNDSGPMHIANAMGIPVLSLFAPTDALTHLPLGAGTLALVLDKDCSPCEVKDHSYFASGQCRCIGEISVEAVEQQVLSLLSPQRRIAGEVAA